MDYIAYVDGSYKNVQGLGEFYSSAAIIAKKGTSDWCRLTKVGNDSLVSMHNVAGELLAAMSVFEHCISVLKLTKEDTLYLHFDYQGIESWTLPQGHPRFWRRKNPITKAYADYYSNVVRNKFNVVFVHVTGHSGEEGNEIVDTLARMALEQQINKGMNLR